MSLACLVKHFEIWIEFEAISYNKNNMAIKILLAVFSPILCKCPAYQQHPKLTAVKHFLILPFQAFILNFGASLLHSAILNNFNAVGYVAQPNVHDDH